MTVGDRIRERRKELGMSQDDLAKKMGYSGKSAISRIENEGNNLTTDRVSKLASALDCTPGYLMGWTDKETKTIEHIRKTLTNIDSVNPLDRVLKRAESDPEYKECIITILNLKKDIRQEIYDYVDFKACKLKQGGHTIPNRSYKVRW